MIRLTGAGYDSRGIQGQWAELADGRTARRIVLTDAADLRDLWAALLIEDEQLQDAFLRRIWRRQRVRLPHWALFQPVACKQGNEGVGCNRNESCL